MSLSCCHWSDQSELIGSVVSRLPGQWQVPTWPSARCLAALLTVSEVGVTVASVASVAVSVASVAITLASPRLRYTFSQHARRCCKI